MANTVPRHSPKVHVAVVGEVEELDVPIFEERPIVQVANPTETVTQADLATMEKRYQDMLRDALAPLHVAQQIPQSLLKPWWNPRSYMKCLNDQKDQCVVFYFTDRGIAWWKTVERMLSGDMTVEQYDAKFDMVSHFAPDVVSNEAARTDKFVSSLQLDLLGFVRAFRPTTYAYALCLAVDISLHERANASKAAGRG
ncbi:gag-protease polyprotein [Cucumis melo var. makuwa]|uniref:Gag-protease polyprotein n=1 Tax=Cucumis melo var. makuwa TaxID=1194695 RepID=A0A5A7TFG4_CUCMM|nr:gag-protease polyprotein [Cucumis melo var. makuwa]